MIPTVMLQCGIGIAENSFSPRLIYLKCVSAGQCMFFKTKKAIRVGTLSGVGRPVLLAPCGKGISMLSLSTVSTLLGAAFGLRFKVLVLVPLTALELCIVAVNGIATGESLGRLAILVSLAATSVQLGYLGGSFIGTSESVRPRQ
jgi:hypothetical protein